MSTCEPAIDLEEASDILKCHPNTVRKYAQKGIIPAFKIGPTWKFRASALDEWMRQLNSAVVKGIFASRSII
jgi:excisionase family DNA binding protein